MRLLSEKDIKNKTKQKNSEMFRRVLIETGWNVCIGTSHLMSSVCAAINHLKNAGKNGK